MKEISIGSKKKSRLCGPCKILHIVKMRNAGKTPELLKDGMVMATLPGPRSCTICGSRKVPGYILGRPTYDWAPSGQGIHYLYQSNRTPNGRALFSLINRDMQST